MRYSTGIETEMLVSYWTNCHYSSASDEVQLGSEGGQADNFLLFDFTYDLLLLMSPLKGKWSFCSLLTFLADKAKCMTFNIASGDIKWKCQRLFTSSKFLSIDSVNSTCST